MDWITIEGFKPYDGRYELDLEGNELTTREWGWLKRLAGYLPATLMEGYTGGDPELFACFAVIALRRAGRVETAEVPAIYGRLVDVPVGETLFRLESDSVDEEAGDGDGAGPPPPSSSSRPPTSGDASPTSSGSSASSPNGSGTPDSDISPSDLSRLAS